MGAAWLYALCSGSFGHWSRLDIRWDVYYEELNYPGGRRGKCFFRIHFVGAEDIQIMTYKHEGA